MRLRLHVDNVEKLKALLTVKRVRYNVRAVPNLPSQADVEIIDMITLREAFELGFALSNSLHNSGALITILST